MSNASLGLTIEGKEYRVKGKKGGLIKINKLTVPQLKKYGQKYTTFTNKNRTKKQILNKIYAAKSKLLKASSSGNTVASALLNLAAGSSKSSSYNANLAAAKTIAALAAKPRPATGKPRIEALLNVAAKPSSAASIGLLPTFGASGGFRAKGAKGPVKLTKYTVPQLKAYAKKHGANVNGLKKKDEILAVIYAKKFGRPLYKVKPMKSSSGVSSPKPASRPSNASLGLLANLGASGGYRVKGVKGPKKVNAKMTVAALKAYGKKYGANVNKLRTKKDILAAIHQKKFAYPAVGPIKPAPSNSSSWSLTSSSSGQMSVGQLNKLLASN